jgi:DNA-binding NarL/FixJ family response regulator
VIHAPCVARDVVVPASGPSAEPAPAFAANTAEKQSLGISARELEILKLIARGLSNREIALIASPKSTIFGPRVQNHPKG